MNYELIIKHENTIMCPPIADGVAIEWDRQGQPGKLTFEVVKTNSLSFEEGDPCRFSVDGEVLFYGFVFDKSRTGSNSNVIKVTVYDQLYYLKNKDTYEYSNKTATEVVKMIAEDFGLNLGSLDDTGYKIATRTEDNKSLSDIIQNALDETLKVKKEMYVLYDKAGKLTLTNIGNMKIGIVINEETAADFDYKTSIAENTYNRIKLIYKNDKAGTRQIFISQDSSNINKWGVLQYHEKIDDTTNAKSMADALLDLYNTKTRTLKIKEALGDTNVRAGTLLVAILGLGDMNVSASLMVEQVKHTFKNNQHLMDLNLRGGNFVS